MRSWLESMNVKERAGVLTLLVILAAVVLFAAGINVGGWLYDVTH